VVLFFNIMWKYESKFCERLKSRASGHAFNVYNPVIWGAYLNCDSLLVYAQTETGPFEELVKINPVYYTNKDLCYRQFGFLTLDLTGDSEEFKGRMNNFADQIKNLADRAATVTH